jgi:hypothetical protein
LLKGRCWVSWGKSVVGKTRWRDVNVPPSLLGFDGESEFDLLCLWRECQLEYEWSGDSSFTEIVDVPDTFCGCGGCAPVALLVLENLLLGGFGGLVVYRQASDGRIDLGKWSRHDEIDGWVMEEDGREEEKRKKEEEGREQVTTFPRPKSRMSSAYERLRRS